MTTNKGDSEMTSEETYGEVLNRAASLIVDKNANPLAVAAALVSIGASIYRTTLYDEDYHTMMQEIYNSRGQIPRFTPTSADVTLQ